MAASLFVAMMLYLSMGEAKPYRPVHYSDYTTGMIQHHEQGKPTSIHKNHCAYVIEKTVSFTVQDGAAPYVKAEYNKCSWHKKCPTLLYRLIYKPIYKVAHKTVTELEWRCCPGYSGYGCIEGPPSYQHPMKSMPPFKGPPFKSPQFIGPPYQGPMFKGPMLKGPPMNPPVKTKPWNQPKEPPTSRFNSYPMHHVGPPRSSSYPDNSFEPYPDAHEPVPHHKEEHRTEHEQEHELRQGPEEHIPEETLPPTDGQQAEGHALDSETEERIYRMEEDVQRLNQGLENLRGTVNGLEESLRASLREDANRMLSALLSAAPSPLSAPPVASSPSTVGFVEIPGGDPEAHGLDGRHVFPGLSKLNGRIEELSTELQAKTAELQELKATVMTHDGALKKMSIREGVVSDSEHLGGQDQKSTEQMLDAKLSAARTDILDGLEKHVESAESRCVEKAEDVRRQCQKEQGQRQEQMEDTLAESTTDLRAELRRLRAEVQHLNTLESCCATMRGLGERVEFVETSVVGLNQSQKHLRVELGGHKDHIEGMLEGRLKYVETKLNLTGQLKSTQPEKRRSVSDKAETGQGLEARMDDKLRELEGRLLTALEELGNATAPALLEGHAVPTLETELVSLRGRLEMDVDRVQKHLSNLEILCSTSCSSPNNPTIIQGDSVVGTAEDQNAVGLLEKHDERLNSLNITLQNIMRHITDKEDQHKEGELTILRLNVHSVNCTLKGLQDSLGTVVNQVGQVNSSWHERESRLARQMKGVVQLVGHQASMLGAGERKLTRLKGEIQEMKRRLAEEVRGCRSTAMGVQKEVTEVGGRVANVEDQCKGLNYLAEDLERIREELERQSNGFLLQFNGTLSSHSQQLSELRDEIRNCTTKVESAQQSLGFEAESQRGDTFTSK
ncbi:EMILIN-3-like [Dunckerocampus dactyliophorus]|uniref:EMILIN-3-like n=1 Tax=Dunckerocampus dactyliophorus TaxID=161453 RepID=UPI002406CCC1|nr:EMILIN-3-like [Dunckerocampus dactyliophorus]